jgi:hypothetical protein
MLSFTLPHSASPHTSASERGSLVTTDPPSKIGSLFPSESSPQAASSRAIKAKHSVVFENSCIVIIPLTIFIIDFLWNCHVITTVNHMPNPVSDISHSKARISNDPEYIQAGAILVIAFMMGRADIRRRRAYGGQAPVCPYRHCKLFVW